MYFPIFPVENKLNFRLDLPKRTEITANFSGIKGVLYWV